MKRYVLWLNLTLTTEKGIEILSVASNSKRLESYQSKREMVLKSLKYQLIYWYDRIRGIISYKVTDS